LSIQEIDRYQRGLIITDDNAFEPILDFNLYRDAIVNIINNSYPKFTIGIFGDWGTGKTTLMNSINDELELQYKENVHTVWFDAWKYENEKEFALIPLLKTINYSIKDDKNEKKKKLKEALKEAAIFTLGVSSDIISSVITNYAGRNVGTLFKRSLEDATTKLIPKLKELNSLSEIDRNTIFYDGIENIQKAINELQTPDNPFRFVIFIDDLDRCSEDKILEILESIKIFLSLKGIIYVLGISHDRIIELINKKFQTNNGEQYIKKIIQIPITLPKWINQDIVDFITNLKKKGIINHKYQEVFNQENIELISEAIENNPREIKRFLNNFIVASEIFSSKQVVAKELLVIQAIQLRWNKFYDLLMKSNENFRKELNRYIEMNEEKRLKYLESDETKKDDRENYDLSVRRSLREFKTNTYLWEFLIKNSSTINNIENWNIYRRATEVGIELPTQKIKDQKEAYTLLLEGKIDIFNERRRKGEFRNLNLSGIVLSRRNLFSTDLSSADLSSADLSYSNLPMALLPMANLSSANLSHANLLAAKLLQADLSSVNLSDTDLSSADLSSAKLLQANFSSAIIRGTNFSKSIIITPLKYEKLILDENTKFNDAIIDDPNFIDYISKKTKYVTQKIKDKKELKIKLKEKGISDKDIENLLKISKLLT
jgi:uncharacterized protein YjbI with pentapeptide repeats